MKRKAQATIDYLTTFAWMSLVLLLVAGIALYTGFFDFSQPKKTCYTGEQLVCKGSISDGNKTQIALENALGRELIIEYIILSEEDIYSFDATLLSGQRKTFELAAGSQESFIILYKTENDYRHSIKGVAEAVSKQATFQEENVIGGNEVSFIE